MEVTIRRVAALAAGFALRAALIQAQTYNISTFAGNGISGFLGDAGLATQAELAVPVAVAVDKSGNVYVADQVNERIRQISNGNITTVAGNGTMGYTGDGAAALSATFTRPNGMGFDSSGNLYIADTGNNVIRKVTGSTISTLAGSQGLGAGFGGDGAVANKAQLNQPLGVAVDSSGNVYIADFGNSRIRKVGTDGNISTFAGNGTAGFGGDGGQAAKAMLNGPRTMAFDGAGNMYVADSNNHRIRMIAPNGIITTVAGSGAAGFSGDFGPATQAALNLPRGLAVDTAGTIYIADYANSRIRKVQRGVISTIAGNGRLGYTGDGGPAVAAALEFPLSVAVDASGNVFIADAQNNVIRQLTPNASSTPAMSSGGVLNPVEFGGSHTLAPGSWVEIYGSNLAATSRDWSAAFDGINAPTLLGGVSVTIGGKPAYLSYVSPGQVNAQVPSGVATGTQNVVVTSTLGVSQPLAVTVAATQPGLFAPQSFNIGGKQYAAAVFPDGAYVLPAGALDGVTSRRARPGDTISLFGIGFGAVTPDTPAGQLVQRVNSLNQQFQASFGSTAANVSYSGLALSAVGLYQFNVTVPAGVSGDVPFTFSLGGTKGTQTLYIAVQ